MHLDSKAVQEQQRSTGHGPPEKKTGSCIGPLGGHLQEKQLLLSEARTRAAGGGEVKTGEEELLSMQELN